jgi:hypothetical protein
MAHFRGGGGMSTEVYCAVRRQLRTDAFLGLLFNPENGDDIFF